MAEISASVFASITALAMSVSIAQAATSRGAQGVGPTGETSSRAELSEVDAESGETEVESHFTAAYSNLFYGPSVSSPTSRYQPSPNGTIDRTRPVSLRNFFSLGYRFNDELMLSAVGSFHNEPVKGLEFQIKDPFLCLSHNSLINVGGFNLYGELRAHFPVTIESRENDMLAGFQSRQVASYEYDRWTFGLWGSERANYFGKYGNGNDMELYLGPNVYYQIKPKLALTLLYEMGASHQFGAEPFHFTSDGTDLQPGVSWDVTPNLNVSPYFNLYTGDRVALDNTSIGLSMYWKFF